MGSFFLKSVSFHFSNQINRFFFRGCGNIVPHMGIDIVLYNASSIFIHITQRVLGIGILLLGRKRERFQSSCGVTTLEFILPIMIISIPPLSRTSQKHGNGYAEDCGQSSHMGIMARQAGVGGSEGQSEIFVPFLKVPVQFSSTVPSLL